MAQQTSVEWLDNVIKDLIPNDIGSQLKYKNKIEQAKEKHKEETIIARENGIIEGARRMNNSYYGNWVESDKYYKETYNK
jgi:hypothetical protein